MVLQRHHYLAVTNKGEGRRIIITVMFVNIEITISSHNYIRSNLETVSVCIA